jgi:catechol 2,3-dioxygenase-like lactoylglutathione lyase family enzyme
MKNIQFERAYSEWRQQMKLDGFGIMVKDMPAMVRFYRDVLGFEIKEDENTSNVYLKKDGTLFMLYGRSDFEKMTSRKYEYVKDLNGHTEMALYVDTFEEVDKAYSEVISKGAVSVLAPETEPWGQRTCYIADPEGNLIEIGSFNKPFEEKDL